MDEGTTHALKRWKFNVLGELSISAPDGERVSLPGKKHQALVAFLVASRNNAVSREKAMDLLWGSRSGDQAKASLRGVLSEIRRTLKPYPDAPIAADRAQIHLTKTPIETDIGLLNAAHQSNSVTDMLSAVRLYSGEFLENLHINERSFEFWKQAEQTSIRRMYSAILRKLIDALGDSDQPGDMEEAADRLLVIDRSDEVAHRALMRLYGRQGQQSLALRQFEICKQRLWTDYGTAPAGDTVELYKSIRSSTDLRPPEPPRIPNLAGHSKPARSQRIALAAIPFTVNAPNPDDCDFGIMLAEEIISAAACFKWFRVIPRNELFKKSLMNLGPVELTRTTGAKYVLDGRLRRSPQGYALTVELVDGENSNTVWSEKFSIEQDEFPYPKETVAQITSRLDVTLRVNEISQAHRLDRDQLSAYECTLLALSNMFDLTLSSYEDAERLFERAVTLNPDHSSIYSFWCLWRMFYAGQGWAEDPESEYSAAASLARQAIKHDPGDALAVAMSGHLESFCNHDFRHGLKKFEESLHLNPYSSFAWMLSSVTYSYIGEPREALRRLAYSHSLCPTESPFEFMFDCAYCIAHNFNGEFDLAMDWGLKTVKDNPGFTNGYKLLLVALGHLERAEDCRMYLKKLQKLVPDFNIRSFLTQYPFGRESDRQLFIDGLVKAGVPRDRKR